MGSKTWCEWERSWRLGYWEIREVTRRTGDVSEMVLGERTPVVGPKRWAGKCLILKYE